MSNYFKFIAILISVALIAIFFSAYFRPSTDTPINSTAALDTTDTYKGTLKNIIKNKTLRVLTTESSFNYFIYQGKESGYEYDMAKSFVDYLNEQQNFESEPEKIKLKMIPIKYDDLFSMLKMGAGDIIAAGTTSTEKRQELADFSIPYNTVDEIIVTGAGESIESLKDLAGREIHIRKSSSYYDSLKELNKKMKSEGLKPLNVKFVAEHLDTESVLELVSMGEYKMTVADSHLAYVGYKVFGNLTLNENITLSQERSIAWAISKGANQLKRQINKFLPKYQKGSLYGNMNIKRYYKNIPHIKTRYFSEEKNRISPYDELFKKYGEKYGWDWRLLAALAYQESRFRQNIKNRWGAIGVMQIKRKVASEPYVGISSIEGPSNYEQNIHAGVKYLTWLKNTFFDKDFITKKQQIHLSLAAYNAGPGRLRQARKKAEAMGYDPNIWFGELEYVLLKMDKVEPVKYVGDIHRRTTAYSIMGIEEEDPQ